VANIMTILFFAYATVWTGFFGWYWRMVCCLVLFVASFLMLGLGKERCRRIGRFVKRAWHRHINSPL
jgi:hypothetical protein